MDLRARRLALGLTQVQLAEKLGLPPNTVARWERQEVEPQHPVMLDLALRALEQAQAEAGERLGAARSHSTGKHRGRGAGGILPLAPHPETKV
jgi:transcriptional regulator with XRE-family HTH domain